MVNINKMIKRIMRQRHINKADISRKLGLHYSSVNGMFKRNTLQVGRLWELSEILNYNFFEEIAEQIPITKLNKGRTEEELLSEIKLIREENKILKAQIDVLKEVMSK